MGERKGLRQVQGPLRLIVRPVVGPAGAPGAELECGHIVYDPRRDAELPGATLVGRRKRCRYCQAEQEALKSGGPPADRGTSGTPT